MNPPRLSELRMSFSNWFVRRGKAESDCSPTITVFDVPSVMETIVTPPTRTVRSPAQQRASTCWKATDCAILQYSRSP